MHGFVGDLVAVLTDDGQCSHLVSFRFVSPGIGGLGSKIGSIKFVFRPPSSGPHLRVLWARPHWLTPYNRTSMVEQRREVMERWAALAYAIVNFST